ncbi:MAG: hypothetical protein QGG58_06590, partial [Chloroflexota bacterium]|nr:hypothetical protein [Chloroflexota bacterium]
RLGRAVLWSAGREPQMHLEVSASAAEMVRADLGDQRATLQWEDAPSGLVLEDSFPALDFLD